MSTPDELDVAAYIVSELSEVYVADWVSGDGTPDQWVRLLADVRDGLTATAAELRRTGVVSS